MIDRFEEMLLGLSKVFDTPMQMDNMNCWSLVIDEKFSIQMELADNKKYLLIISFISEIPPGKYRENILRFALIANNNKNQFGTFGYSEKVSKLLYFTYLYFEDLKVSDLADYLSLFIETASTWREAIETSNYALIDQTNTSSSVLQSPMNFK